MLNRFVIFIAKGYERLNNQLEWRWMSCCPSPELFIQLMASRLSFSSSLPYSVLVVNSKCRRNVMKVILDWTFCSEDAAQRMFDGSDLSKLTVSWTSPCTGTSTSVIRVPGSELGTSFQTFDCGMVKLLLTMSRLSGKCENQFRWWSIHIGNIQGGILDILTFTLRNV